MPFIGGFRAVGFTQSRRRYPAFIEGLGSITGTDFVRRDGTTPLSGTWDVGGQEINNVSRLIIGSTVDLGPVLQVEGGGVSSIELRDNPNDATEKFGGVHIAHYTNAEEPMAMIWGDAQVAANVIFIGGGHVTLNAATRIQENVAADTTTTTGTEIRRTTIVGTRYEIPVSGDPADLFHIDSAAGLAVLVQDSDGFMGLAEGTPLRQLHIKSGQPFRFNNAAADGFEVTQTNALEWAWSGLSGGMKFRLRNADFLVPDGRIGVGILDADSIFHMEADPAATPDDIKAIAAVNLTPATVGAQKYSPMFRRQGSGWKTDAAAASQTVEFRDYVIPIQGAAAPTADLVWESSINGAAYVRHLRMSSSGYIDFIATDQAVGLTKVAGDPASPVDGDIWYDTVSDDLQFEANSLTEKVSVSRYAEIYVQNGSTPQTITTGGTFEKFIGFTTNADSDGMTADAVNDKLTLTRAGLYIVLFQISFSGTGGAIVDFQVRWDGNVQQQVTCERKLAAGGDVGSASMIGIIDATSPATDVEIWFTADDNGDAITVVDAQLNATWLGTT